MRKLILPLTENHLFSKAYSKGKCEVCKYVAVYLLRNYKRNTDGSPMRTKLGITVNRKLGKACKRNRVKRMIRAAYRESASLVKDGYIIIIAARAAAFSPNVKSTEISAALKGILSKDDFFDLKAPSHNKPKPKPGTAPSHKKKPTNRHEKSGGSSKKGVTA